MLPARDKRAGGTFPQAERCQRKPRAFRTLSAGGVGLMGASVLLACNECARNSRNVGGNVREATRMA